MISKETLRLSILIILLIVVLIGGIAATRETGRSKPDVDTGVTSAEDIVNKQMGEDDNYRYIWFLEQKERVEKSIELEKDYKNEYTEYKKSLKGPKLFYKGTEKRDLKRLEKKYLDTEKTTDKLIEEYNKKSKTADPELFGDELELTIKR